MSRYKKDREEVEQEWNKVEPRELDQLRADISAKKQERINGRLQSRFQQVLLDREIIRFPKDHGKEKLMDSGRHIVMKPTEYTRLNKMNAMIEAADTKEQDRLFRENPELEVEWNEKVQRFIKETRQAVFGLGREKRV